MKRRNFIKNVTAGTAVAATGLAQGKESRVSDDDPNLFDTIVVGGGFAGVTAASDISLDGYKTLLLDARTRLGGRTFTTDFAGHKIDAGGTWIGWGQPSV
jgi:monoamine oxidase